MGCSGDDGPTALETDDYRIVLDDDGIGSCTDDQVVALAGEIHNESASPASYEITAELSNGSETEERQAQIPTVEPGEFGDFILVASFGEVGDSSCEITRVETG